MVSWIEKKCAERGLRMTDQRKVIAKVLSEATDHPDAEELYARASACLLYTSPSPRDQRGSRMPSSA